jgi:DNA-binding NarL/FixJ family response regulator
MAGAQSGTALGIAFGVWLKEQRCPTPLERKRWPCISAHLGAGLRLRAATRCLHLDAEDVEAVLDSGGKVLDARAQATSTSARELLREAVRRIERARTAQGRSDPDAAMESWEGLVDGRWSLVDRFDTDGKRFIIAVKNDPAHPDPRGLTPREREVSAAFFAPAGLRAKLAELTISGEKLLFGAYPLVNRRQLEKLTDAEREVVAHLVAGSTNGDIARRRGTSENTVANQVYAIFLKLGVHSRAELAARLQARD